MQRFKVKWETDGETVDLPDVVNVPNSVKPEDVADWLSDKYGWLVSKLERC